jgi:alkenylglycerophosphocholine hydrolase
VFLLFSNERRWFLFGLGAFLLAHVAYILGFNTPPPPFNAKTIVVAFMVLMSVLPLVRRILLGAVQKGLRRPVEPVRVYTTLISFMLFSALITLFRTDWLSMPAYLVSLGAILFITSDSCWPGINSFTPSGAAGWR